jgi:hypothetical protein
MTDLKKPGVAFWATVAVVVLLIAYPLSWVAIAWLEGHGMTPEQDSARGRVLWTYCAPARWLIVHGPDWLRDSLDWLFGN